jgi:hypothetical protein
MGRLYMHNPRSSAQQLEKSGNAHEKVRRILSDHVGYVLVTCRPTAQPGRMEVEVSYEGDPDLASYLVDGAQGYIENEVQDVEV